MQDYLAAAVHAEERAEPVRKAARGAVEESTLVCVVHHRNPFGNLRRVSLLRCLSQLPKTDLSMRFGCHKLWDESWRIVGEHRYEVFRFNVAFTRTDRVGMDLHYLRNVQIKIKNLDKHASAGR